VLFLDADDLLEAGHLASLLSVASKTRDGAIFAGGWREFEDGAEKNAGRLQSAAPFRDLLRFTSIAYPPWQSAAAIIRKEALVDEFLWPEDLDAFMSEDTAFWFRLLQFYAPTIIENDGLRYRLGSQNSRNEFMQLSRWILSLRHVYDSNVAFMRGRGLVLHWKHSESLMRSYISTWERALRLSNIVVAEEALGLAESWLRECYKSGGWRDPAIALRRICGIPVSARALATLRGSGVRGTQATGDSA
jgi:hypothetical protein